MKKVFLIITGLLLIGQSYASQPSGHVWFADRVIGYGSQNLNLGVFNAPVYGIASHVALDRLAGESKLDYQLDIGGVRLLIMYINTPDNKKVDFLVNLFWGLFPDLWDKTTGRHDFHPTWIEPPIIPLSRGATDLLEEIAVLSYTVKF